MTQTTNISSPSLKAQTFFSTIYQQKTLVCLRLIKQLQLLMSKTDWIASSSEKLFPYTKHWARAFKRNAPPHQMVSVVSKREETRGKTCWIRMNSLALLAMVYELFHYFYCCLLMLRLSRVYMKSKKASSCLVSSVTLFCFCSSFRSLCFNSVFKQLCSWECENRNWNERLENVYDDNDDERCSVLSLLLSDHHQLRHFLPN
jgi:hypothetical protein